jgi:hypothetical protein
VACDFFTVETIRLKTLYVPLFIHLSSRRVIAAGVTANPDSAWVTQQARNVGTDLNDQALAVRILLRDHDAKSTGSHSASASRLLGLDGFEVLAAQVAAGEWQLEVQTTATLVGCIGCGMRAELHDHRTVRYATCPSVAGRSCWPGASASGAVGSRPARPGPGPIRRSRFAPGRC